MGAKILIDQEHFLDFSKFPVTQNFQKCCLSINHFVTSARVKQQTNFADAFTWTQNGQKKSTWCFLHFFPEITRHLTEVGPLMIFYHRQVTINLSLGYCGLICRSIQIDWKAGNRNTKIGNAWNIEENYKNSLKIKLLTKFQIVSVVHSLRDDIYQACNITLKRKHC